MTTSSLRIVAAGIALIFAVLTGLFTGMVGGQVCTVATQPTGQTPGEEQNNPPGRRGGGVAPKEPGESANPPGEEDPGQNPGDPDQNDDPEQPGPGGGIPGDRDGDDEEIQKREQGRQPLAVADAETCEYSFSASAAVVGFLGALIAGGAVTGLLFLRRREDGAVAPAAPVAADQTSAQRAEQLEAERSTLVQTCVYVRDRATSKALADRLGWALQEVGVSTVTPNGARFDPAHHEAGGSAPTADPAQVGAIAAVEVPGYVDRRVVLRAPVVTVYSEEAK